MRERLPGSARGRGGRAARRGSVLSRALRVHALWWLVPIALLSLLIAGTLLYASAGETGFVYPVR